MKRRPAQPAAPASPSPLGDLAAELTIEREAGELAPVPFTLTAPTGNAAKSGDFQPGLFTHTQRENEHDR